MGRYIFRRILNAIPILFGITLLTFFIMQLAPGSPLQTMIDPRISTEEIARAEENLGLDKPIVIQYFSWLWQLLNGNLGYTVRTGQSVSEMILKRLPATLYLTLTAFFLSFVVGVPLGVYSATRKYTLGDYSLTVFAFVGISIPSFFFGLGLVFIFSLRLGVLPTGGMITIGANLTGWAGLVDSLRHLILPAIVLALPNLATVMRFTRSSMIDVLHNDYIRTARAKGVREKAVRYKHALRNAMIPVVTVFGLSVPFLFGGAYITERIFNWPGMGSMGIQAIYSREYPILMGLNLFTSTLVLLGNLLADVLYAAVDPRIRY
jgi:peptide/nickel transport system permease protein